ncbi:MAG TPA: methyltransferase [Rhizomicrobium sp.]|nr:methyltransferase [Rhizomicrobium sp.]
MSAITEDGFLNSRLKLRQPRHGFRAGLDAVMLAAAVPAGTDDRCLELGAGVGTASLCLAARAGCRVTGIEIDAELTELANQNATLNAMADRVSFECADALTARGGAFDHVFCNPPFHGSEGQTSPNAQKARALQDEGTLKDWVRSGVEHIASKGSFTTIIRADRLDEVLAALPAQGVYIFPLLPRAAEPPKRVIVQWHEGGTGQPTRLPGLILHQASGRYTPEADAILRDAAPLRITP